MQFKQFTKKYDEKKIIMKKMLKLKAFIIWEVDKMITPSSSETFVRIKLVRKSFNFI